jgi:hypothetical protein
MISDDEEVCNPRHYRLFADGQQAIDIIQGALTPEEFAGYCKGNVLKYRLRAGEKGAGGTGNILKDIAKADWYKARYAHWYDALMKDRAVNDVRAAD